MQTAAMKKMLPFLVLALALYYGVPAAGAGIGGDLGMGLTILGLLLLNSVYSFLSGFVFALRNGFRWYFPVLLGALFIPAISTYYNSSAAVYLLVYAALAAVGEGLAALVRRVTGKGRASL